MVLSINAEKNIQQNSTSIYDEENLKKIGREGNVLSCLRASTKDQHQQYS